MLIHKNNVSCHWHFSFDVWTNIRERHTMFLKEQVLHIGGDRYHALAVIMNTNPSMNERGVACSLRFLGTGVWSTVRKVAMKRNENNVSAWMLRPFRFHSGGSNELSDRAAQEAE
jgi:hypothetical protein